MSALEAKVEELEGQLERCRSSMQQLEKSEAMILLGLQAIKHASWKLQKHPKTWDPKNPAMTPIMFKKLGIPKIQL